MTDVSLQSQDGPAKCADLNSEGIAITGVTKRFEGLVALKELNLSIRIGEAMSILGPSGCGKSTLLSILGGHETPDEGMVLFRGCQVLGPSPERMTVFQVDSLLPHRSVYENVLLGEEIHNIQKLRGLRRWFAELLTLNGRSRKWWLRTRISPLRQEKAAKWLDMLGLASFSDRFPKDLSVGMRKLAELARVYAEPPALLMLDEPFTSLDALVREEMQMKLEKLWMQAHCTTILVTHDWNEAAAFADRVIVMSSRPGRVLHDILVELPRPRDTVVRQSEAFFKIASELRALVREAARRPTNYND
jgi:NitT/TauT family transport system ATP-binding protein